MKVIAVSKKEDMFKLDVSGTATWYFLSDAVKEFVKKAGIGLNDDVNIESKPDSTGGKTDTIVKVTKIGGSSDSAKGSFGSSYQAGGDSPKTYSKDEQIKKLSVARATAQAIVALQGQVDRANIKETMNEIYDFLYEKVS